MSGRAEAIYRATWVFQRGCSLLFRFLTLSCARWTVEGREHVPKSGGFLLVCNHLSNADPVTVAAATHRHVVFMAKQEIFRAPLGFIVYAYGAFAVRRLEADLAALRRGSAVLRQGKVLGMFPEGTRSKGRGLLRPHPGVAVLALRTNALIVPAAVSGTERLLGPRLPLLPLRRPRVTVRFGEPFRLPAVRRVKAEDARGGAEEIMRRIAALLPPEYRGEYGRALLSSDGQLMATVSVAERGEVP